MDGVSVFFNKGTSVHISQSRCEKAIEAALIADSYSLATHWIYDWEHLDSLSLDWNSLNAPQAHWHKDKVSGDNTHYGDHTIWLLEFIREYKTFNAYDYSTFWKNRMQSYSGYIDTSSKETLAILSEQAHAITGSNSNDLSIIGRIAPLTTTCSDKSELLSIVQSFVALTHNSERVLLAANYIADILFEILAGKDLAQLLQCTRIESSLQGALKAGLNSQHQDTSKTIRNFGPACSIEGAFESVIHLLCTYDNFEQAMIANAKAGGDSAARAMLVGMLMGAADKPVPEAWKAQYRKA